ncbi:MAG TPA: SAF domain-containing protein [Mycobacteriales bacterium]|jgi:Flp pilus assembly protein CpaB
MAGVDIRERLRSRLATVSRLARWPRRLLALGLLGGAALLAARAHAPDPPTRPVPTLTVLVAARDLAAGRLLSAAAVRPETLPRAAAPHGVLRPGDRISGRRLAAPVRQGEPLTDVRFADAAPATAAHGPGTVSVPVRLADADTAALLHPGDRVDVLAVPAGAESGPATVIARDLPVVTVPRPRAASATDGALVVLAAPEPVAGLLAGAAADRVTVALHPP